MVSAKPIGELPLLDMLLDQESTLSSPSQSAPPKGGAFSGHGKIMARQWAQAISEVPGKSSTAELWDVFPRFVFGKQSGGAKIERRLQYRKKRYRLVLTPAVVDNGTKQGRILYPGKRERIVEDVLRKFASEGDGLEFRLTTGSDGTEYHEIGVTFGLFQLYKELARTNHSHTYKEIKEALAVLTQCQLGVFLDYGNQKEELIWQRPYIEITHGKTSENWEGKGKKTQLTIYFSRFVTESVLRKSWRRYNYELGMSLKNDLSLWLLKRLSHNFTQASPLGGNNVYHISYKAIVDGSGIRSNYTYASQVHHKRIAPALNELVVKGVLEANINDNGDEITPAWQFFGDAYELRVSINFCNEMHKSNKIAKGSQ